MDREIFLTQLCKQFPEVANCFGKYSFGLLHVEMADFRRVVEEAMDSGQLWKVEKYLQFIDDSLTLANPALQNAIEVSFLEDFALGRYDTDRHRIICERMPKRLRDKIIQFDNRWA